MSKFGIFRSGKVPPFGDLTSAWSHLFCFLQFCEVIQQDPSLF
jgi:hypothetical protein